MNVQYVSDLHYENYYNRRFLRDHPLRPVGDVLVLAGDVMPLCDLERYKDFVDFISAHWEFVIWVPGNHEFYHSNIQDFNKPFCTALRENVFLTNENSIIYKGIEFIGATLWGSVSKANEQIVENNVNDFKAILSGDRLLSANDYNLMHSRQINFIKKQLQNRASHVKAQIVVTHHVPTQSNYPEKYKNSILNEAFVTEQKELITTFSPEFWIYGHHHQNTENFKIGSTHLLNNQLGYVEYNEHVKFKHSRTLNVPSPY